MDAKKIIDESIESFNKSQSKYRIKNSEDFELIGEHTHFHSYKHSKDAGHYHFDVTPNEIEYEGYFNISKEVYRVNNIYKELID